MAKATKASVDFQINENGTATASITPEDANGNDTTMPVGATTPAWVASDADLSLAPSADGLTCVVTAGTTAITAATIAVSSTLADGVTVISGTSDPIDVVPNPPGSAVAFKIVLSSSTPPASRRR